MTPFNETQKDGRKRSTTKNAVYKRAHYQRTREKQLVTAKAKTESRRRLLHSIKITAGCADCGYNAHPVALDFDHRPGEKKLFCVASGLSRSLKSLFLEIMKCDVVCSNCHRIRTAERRAYSM